MSDSKPSKTKSKADIELLKSDVASFASSLGLSSAAPSSGFNDSDFRKTGPIKLQKKSRKNNIQNSKNDEKNDVQRDPRNSQATNFNRSNQKSKLDKKYDKPQKHNDIEKAHFEQEPGKKMEKSSSKPMPKPPVLTLDSGGNHDKYKRMPKLPLVKAGNLGVWYIDAKELEDKVLGGEEESNNSKRVVELKDVEKKRELGERLLWQYVSDYEGSRGQTGDIKMLVATQRSGTAADKVSAFSVMVGDNPVANLRSLDALLGMLFLYLNLELWVSMVNL